MLSLTAKKLFSDSAINFAAVFIPLVLLQFVVMPLMASRVSADEYGLAVTLLALLNVCPAVLANSLNNVRLIERGKRGAEVEQGDFKPALLLFEAANVVVVFVVSVYYQGGITEVTAILLGTSLVWLVREYCVVHFLEKLNYKKVLINGIVLTAGYFVGLGLLYLDFSWAWVYFMGNAFSAAYVWVASKAWSEPFAKTAHFASILKDSLILVASGLIGRMMSYADRLLLYPLMGGEAVAIYYAAALFGKMISLVAGPVANVLLSYLSASQLNEKNAFKSTLIAGFVVGVAGTLVVLIISEPLLSVLYPRFVESAIPYVGIATVACFVSSISTLINPFVLRYLPTRWQMIIGILSLCLYVVLSFVLYSKLGLMGFCIGVLVSNMFKMGLQIFVFVRYSKEKDSER